MSNVQYLISNVEVSIVFSAYYFEIGHFTLNIDRVQKILQLLKILRFENWKLDFVNYLRFIICHLEFITEQL